MKSMARLLVSVCMLSLAACTSTEIPKQQINQAQHQAQLAHYSDWRLKGKLAFKSETEKFSAYINWQQRLQTFALSLNSFIGTNLMRMQGKPGFAELEADDNTYTDSDASRLILRVTGWNIPVQKMSMWVKGQHEPQDNVTYDSHGLVSQLRPSCDDCQQWLITYGNYQRVDNMWLPHDLALLNTDNEKNQIKIRIDKWQ